MFLLIGIAAVRSPACRSGRSNVAVIDAAYRHTLRRAIAVGLGGALADGLYAAARHPRRGAARSIAHPTVPPILYAISGVILLVYGFLTARSQPVQPAQPAVDALASDSPLQRKEMWSGFTVGLGADPPQPRRDRDLGRRDRPDHCRRRVRALEGIAVSIGVIVGSFGVVRARRVPDPQGQERARRQGRVDPARRRDAAHGLRACSTLISSQRSPSSSRDRVTLASSRSRAVSIGLEQLADRPPRPGLAMARLGTGAPSSAISVDSRRAAAAIAARSFSLRSRSAPGTRARRTSCASTGSRRPPRTRRGGSCAASPRRRAPRVGGLLDELDGRHAGHRRLGVIVAGALDHARRARLEEAVAAEQLRHRRAAEVELLAAVRVEVREAPRSHSLLLVDAASASASSSQVRLKARAFCERVGAHGVVERPASMRSSIWRSVLVMILEPIARATLRGSV